MGNCGFSLLELLVAVSILGMMLVMMVSVLGQVQESWRVTRGKVSQFEEARRGLEAVSRRLSQATLNTYWAYDDNELPTSYVRQSELHYVSGGVEEMFGSGVAPGGGRRTGHAVFFQAPFGFAGGHDEFVGYGGLLNVWGYYLEHRSDAHERPGFLGSEVGVAAPRWRWRLMEYRPPAQQNRVYDEALKQKVGVGKNSYFKWFADARPGGVNHMANYRGSGGSGGARTVRVLADNVVALVLLPRRVDDGGGDPESEKLELAPDYEYDTRRWQWQGGGEAGGGDRRSGLTQHVLPPLVDVTLVAIDERSAVRLGQFDGAGGPAGAALELVPAGLFRVARDYDRDLEQLESRLRGDDGVLPVAVDYRVFQTTVKMRASGWSEYYGNGRGGRRGGRR